MSRRLFPRAVRSWRTALAVLVGLVLVATTTPALAVDAGTVVAGRVTDAAGNPLAGVRVYFDDNFDLDNPAHPVFATSTATDGTYRALRTTAAGPTWVQFVGLDATGASSDSGYLPGYLADPDGSRQVVVPRDGGRVARANVTLAAAAGARGTVITDTGQPLANVAVQMFANAAFGGEDAYARTDGAGNWVMRGIDLLGAGSLSATFEFSTAGATGGASPTGYPYACLGLVSVPCDRRYLDGPAPAYVTLVPGRAAGANITLPPAAALHGRVVDAAGHAVVGTSIGVFGPVVRRSNGDPNFAAVGNEKSGRDGTWTVRFLLPQTYAVCYGWYGSAGQAPNAEGYTTECSHDSPRSAGAFAGLAYRVTSGQDRQVNDSLVANGAVAGRVVDEQGNPVSRADVEVGYLDASGAFLPSRGRDGSAGDGTFRVGGVSPGRPVVCATAQHFAETCPPVGTAPTTVLVRPGRVTAGVTVVLHRVP